MDVLYNINFAIQGIKFRRRTSIPTFWHKKGTYMQ